MENRTDALVIFAKYPEPGKVKTRLAAAIGAVNAANLYREFLQMTLEKAHRLPVAELIVAYDPAEKAEEFATLLGPDCHLLPQRAGDLGQRMDAAFRELLRRHSRVVILGTDSPSLPGAYIRDAFSALDRCDVVLGPTEDGGYYLIGLREPQPRLFTEIPWSTEAVLRATLERAEELRLRLHLLPVWHDIDTLSDLRKALLYDAGPLREMLKRHGLEEACASCVPDPSHKS